MRVSLLLFLVATSCTSYSLPPVCSSLPAPKQPANFHQSAGGLYRGAALRDCGEIAYLKSLGVTHVLQLNAPPEADGRTVDSGGVAIREMSFNAATIATRRERDRVGEALAYIGANQPVYVHCSRGKDRTGYVIGLYELLFLHRPVDEVLSELHRDGHGRLERFLFGDIDRSLSRRSTSDR